LPPQLEQVNLNAAGIDVGSREHWVAVPKGRSREGGDVRCFGAFTADLKELADWLEACGIETVAMESTGVYWIPLYELLVSRGFDVQLVNPRQLKNVPGRKTDVMDCQWLQILHTFGLLRGSFRPREEICVLRGYERQREMLVRSRATPVQHMQKALDQMNVKLHKVVSDITGSTGLGIVRAIVGGERDPKELAKHRDRRCKSSVEEIEKALEGTWREEHLFALRQAVELYDVYTQQLEACDRKIEEQLKKLGKELGDGEGGGSGGGRGGRGMRKGKGGTNRSRPSFDVRGELYRITGVDLTEVGGIAETTALGLVAEIGTDMSAWPTEKHFASWAGLCPGNNVSGGKRLSGKNRRCASRVKQLLLMGAKGVANSDCALGAFYRRMRSRVGATKALRATAHKLARIVYKMLKYRRGYKDMGAEYYEQRYRERVVRQLRRRAKAMGFELKECSERIAAAWV